MPQRFRLVLHVGPPRTGSSHLQQQLAAQRLLLAEHGVVYPSFGPADAGHERINDFVAGRDAPEVMEQLPRMRAAETLLLSCESLVRLDERGLGRLGEAFPRHDLQVIFVLRGLEELVPSQWEQTVWDGSPRSFGAHLERLERREDADLLEILPSVSLARLAACVGRSSLAILDHARLADAESLVGAFVRDALGIAAGFERTHLPSDARQPASRVELLRSLNERHVAKHGTSPGSRLRQAYLALRPEIEPTPVWKEWVADFEAVAHETVLTDRSRLSRDERLEVAESLGDRLVTPLAERAAGSSMTRWAPEGWSVGSHLVSNVFARLDG